MKRIGFSILAILLMGIACSSTPSESAIQTAIAQTESAKLSSSPSTRPTNTPLPINTKNPTSTKTPTKTAAPTYTPTPSIGSRLEPVKVGEQISLVHDSAMNFTIWIDQVIRGNDAWTKIYDTNMYNDEPPEGQEYILVYLKVIYTQGPQDRVLEFGNRDFITVSRGQIINIPSLVMPEPKFEDIALFPGGEAEGWIAGTVYTDDENPLLGFDFDSDNASGFFFLLTP